TISSQGDREVLWNYYQEGRDFMKTWSAMESRPEIRSFGYAYSELIIRNYVARMNGSLRELYSHLSLNYKISDPQQKWRFYSQYLDMTPCKYESRDRFRECLETINEYDYPVYSAQPTRDSKPLNITELEIPEREKKTGSKLPTGDVSFRQFLQGFVAYVFSSLRSLIRALAASA
ncbi:MAG: hypothetical protein ABEJ66_03785, partial [Candidatus Nanohaloarchaea archaeon]